MKYENYKKSRNLVWEILLEEEVCELPVRVLELCRRMGIEAKIYESRNSDDGYSSVIDGRATIYINKEAPLPRQRFTAAHELGHILLGHVGEYRLVNREPNPKDNPIESAANVFAARLLSPACVLWGCNVKTANEIMRLCDISRKAAEYRMKRMEVLYRRNRFLTSEYERLVYEMFGPFIEKNRL